VSVVVEPRPERCPFCWAPWPYEPGQVLVSWLPCTCQPDNPGHRTYLCRTCNYETFVPNHVNSAALVC
jgi:hypothetical protein